MMLPLFNSLFDTAFIPHGHCYLWQPSLVSLHFASDALIALAYYSIPAILIYFVRRRQDLPFNWIFQMFAAFILCCGTTHLMAVWTLWYPDYWISGLIKAITAVVSLATAVLLVPLMPRVLALPSLEALNQELQAEVAFRIKAQEQLCALKNELAEQLAEMTRLQELSARLSTTLELQPIVEEAIAAVTALQHAPMGILMLYDKDANRLYPAASVGLSAEYLDMVGRVTPGEAPWGEIFAHEPRAIAVEDADADEGFAPYREVAQKEGYRAAYSTPLLGFKGELIGSLATYFPETHRPSPQENSRVELYTRQAGWAIANGRLYENLQVSRAELAQSEARYRIMGEALPFGVWMCDPQGNPRYLSQSFLDLVQMTLEECQEFGWMKRVPPEAVEPTKQAWQHCVATGDFWDWEHRILGADGQYRTVLSRGRPVRDDRGQIASWVGINLDISDRKQMERERVELLAQVATKQRLLEAVLQQMPAGVVVAEAPSGRLFLMNEQVRHILGGDYPTVEGVEDYLQDYQVFYPNGRAYTPEELALARALQIGEVVINEEAEILRLDGSRCIALVNAAPVRDAEGNIIAGVAAFYDITDRKRVEAERAKLLEQEQQMRELAEDTTERIGRLQAVTTSLSEAVTASQVAEAILSSGLAALEANVGTIALLSENGKGFHILRSVGYPPEITAAWSHFSIDAPVPIADAVRSRSPIWLESREACNERYPDLAEIHAICGNGALVAIPLTLNDRPIGALAFAFPDNRHFDRDDRSFIHALAQQCAQALERSRLFEAEQVARAEAEKALTALQHSEARFTQLVESNVIGIVIGNFHGQITYANDAFLHMLGYTRAELEAGELCWNEMTPPEYWPLDWRSQAQMLAWGHCTPYEKEFLAKDGNPVPILIGSALLDGYQDTAVCFVLDLTQRKQAEAQRDRLLERERAARAEAESANRIKDEFLAVLSHELRTPLNPILGWAKLLQLRKYDESTHQRALETIERNAKLLSQLIEDLLDVSRILRGKLLLKVSEVNLNATIEAAIETVRLAAQAKSISVRTQFDASVTVLGDGNRLQQVLWNLLTNAVKFTPSGGEVTVGLHREGDRAVIRVRDTGMGIDPQFLPHVFEYFRQADSTTTRSFGGLGLGLAIVRYLTELHGGTVRVDSEGVGGGATFTVMLPRRGMSAEMIDEGIVPPQSFTLEGMKVLVVDDEADSRELVSAILQNYGAQVQVEASGTAALQAIPTFQPDVLVSDIAMPDMDGYMLLRQVRALAPDAGGEIPAIALTAYAGDRDRDRILEAGFAQHVAKPIDAEALVAAISLSVRTHTP